MQRKVIDKKNVKREIANRTSNRSQNNQVKTFDIKNLDINVKPRTENQKAFLQLIDDKEITIGAGYAGTGKTYLACAKALMLLKEGKYNKIVLIKSVTGLPGEDIGWIPGSIESKMEGTMFSFMFNFNKLVGDENTEHLKDNNYIEVLPLTYIRGISIDNAIIICDEVQNLDYDKCETLLTRLGSNSKLILIGDERQIDLKDKKSSVLDFLCEKFKDASPKISTIRFLKEDIVRNPLIKLIEEIFDKYKDEMKK